MNPTKIEWCDETWNPVSGCSKVSQGCKNCYAERMFPRPYAGDQWPNGDGTFRPRRFTDVECHLNRLDQPLRMRKPRRIFVNSMSDLFHEDVPDEFIDRVFAVMAIAQQHTFLVLTKRPERMREYLSDVGLNNRVGERMACISDAADRAGIRHEHPGWGFVRPPSDPMPPLQNVLLGVSCEDQATADERIPLLLKTPAAVRFVSAEPLIGRVDFCEHLGMWWNQTMKCFESVGKKFNPGGLDWVIVGGESGPGARPFDVQWARDIVAQCKAAGVPVFVKQLGARPIVADKGARSNFPLRYKQGVSDDENGAYIQLDDRKGGDWTEWPEDLRVREWPR